MRKRCGWRRGKANRVTGLSWRSKAGSLARAQRAAHLDAPVYRVASSHVTSHRNALRCADPRHVTRIRPASRGLHSARSRLFCACAGGLCGLINKFIFSHNQTRNWRKHYTVQGKA